MNTKFLATSLDKLSSDIRIQIIIAGLTLVSVVLGILVFLPQIDVQDYLRPIFIFDFIVVIILAVDFYARMKASKQGFRYLKNHWYEIPAMIPLYFFFIVEYAPLFGTAFRSLRVLRVFRLLPLLRLANLFRTAHILRASGFVYVMIISTAAIIFGALGIYEVEMSNPEANIKDYGSAVWFAFTTITISIYGDVYPVTMEGKIIAAILILTGLAMILSFIASFGATLVESKLKTKVNLAEESRDLIKDKIDNLEKLEHDDIDTLTAMIKSLHGRLQKDSEQLYSCSNCGNSSIHKAIFCSNCGVKLAINNSKQ
jgi:voltage-gated potassium channel